MKKPGILIVVALCVCVLLCACGKPEKLSVNTPEDVYATFCSGEDSHHWKLSEEEMLGWLNWINELRVSPVNLEESQMLIDYMYNNGSKPQYIFDIGKDDSLETMAYFEVDSENGYIHMEDSWYHVDRPTEPFKKY